VARITKTETKPLALIDSNVLVYAMIKDYPNEATHKKCLTLLEKGLKGELNYILTINPIVVVEVFSALQKLLNGNDAQSRISALLDLRRLAFLQISKQNCQTSVLWAKEENIPINDALIAANMLEHAKLIYTTDAEHFKKLQQYGVKICNPTINTPS
jgi:predicted nucleic acid-binding protein